MRKTGFAPDAISLPNQAADFDVRKSVEIGTNAWQLPLHFGVQRSWVLASIDEISDARKEKPWSVLKRFILQLPDSIHENVAGAHRCANEPTGSQVATHFEGFSHIANKHAIPRRFFCFRQLREIAKHANTEVIKDAAVRVRLSAKFAASRANFGSGEFHRWEETGKRRRSSHGHRHRGQADRK